MPGVRREGEQQSLVGGEMIENRGQKSRLFGRRPQTIPSKARQSQERIEPAWISGQKGQNLNRYRFGGGFGELWRFSRRGPEIEFFHYNDFPFVNLYPLYRFPFRQVLSVTDECG
jgi:hypothetical protein